MGQIGRGMIRPLIRRQYAARDSLLNHELKRTHHWWRNAIGFLPPRSVQLTLLSPMGAHSDDQGQGRISARSLLPYDIAVSTRTCHIGS